eukprot:evm.model.scf_2240.1 EVM.evm.TU.scf_2240.1   scf_2240:446-5849(+)
MAGAEVFSAGDLPPGGVHHAGHKPRSEPLPANGGSIPAMDAVMAESSPGTGGHDAEGPDSAGFRVGFNPVFGQEGVSTPLARFQSHVPSLEGDLKGMASEVAVDLFESWRPREGGGGRGGAPADPEWNRSRPYLTGECMWTAPAGYHGDAEGASLDGFSPAVQEARFLDDLLYGFMGLDGRYVRAEFVEGEGGVRDVRFTMAACLEPSLGALVERMLPICEHVVVLQRFIETRSYIEFGVVCHAVAAAMRQVLEDWLLMVTQLESQLRVGRLTAQSLWFYAQPPMAALGVLASVARDAAANGLTGTGLLSLLHIKMGEHAGDMNAQGLLQKLLAAGCKPYFDILEQWLCEGVLNDPYSEFMIQEDTSIGKTAVTEDMCSGYWRNRYRLRVNYVERDSRVTLVPVVPKFLEDLADVILTTGKQINAIRECNRPVERPLHPDEHITYDTSKSYVKLIHGAHREASRAFLELVMKELRLIPWLRGLKHFFLLDQGDMMGHLMDIAEKELGKKPAQISHTRLQSLLELAVRTSSIPADVKSEGLQIEFDARTLMELARAAFKASVRNKATHRSSVDSARFKNNSDDLKGWEIFMLQYRIDWPMSLIVSPRHLIQYQLLFKHLFLLKRVERELNRAWQACQLSRGVTERGSRVLRRVYSLCQQMMHVFQQYLRFMTFEVLEPHWHLMEGELQKASSIDRVIEVHREFITKVMKASLLRKAKVVSLFEKLEGLALKFARQVTETIRVDDGPDDAQNGACPGPDAPPGSQSRWRSEQWRAAQQKVREGVKAPEFIGVMKAMEESFKSKMRDLIVQLGDLYEHGTKSRPDGGGVGYLNTREELDGLLNLTQRLDYRALNWEERDSLRGIAKV